jgi:hypothetical protein
MDPDKPSAPSLRVAQTLRVFSVQSNAKGVGSKSTSQLKRMVRSPSDEVLMTELAIDAKDLTIYDISSVILVGEKAEANPHGEFKCYMDNISKEFFIEITNKTKLEAFTRSAVLNLLEVAEEAGAETAYLCIRKSVDAKALAAFVKNFSFIGFIQLNSEEQKKISMTQTHTLLKYKIKGDDLDF